MDVNEDQKRRIAEVGEAINRVMPGEEPDGDDPEVVPGSVLVKYTVVADWLTPEGERIISRFGGNLDGEPATTWDMAGLLHEALNGRW